MRLGLTFDLQTDPADPRQAEFDPPATIAAVQEALTRLGHAVRLLGSAEDVLRRPDQLAGIELVFNIAEGSHGRCREAWAPNALELLGVPYVGSDALALMIGLDKVVCKQLATAAGIATPKWVQIVSPAHAPWTVPFPFPVIVKPRYEGSGRGIDAGAVVHDAAALRRRVEWLYQECRQPMLIEQFIPDGELTVLLIGNDPPEALPAIQRPLDPATGLSCHVVHPAPVDVVHPVVLEERLEAQARRDAVAMFEQLGCRDMARVDFRVDAQGRAYFLEINPLPSFDPQGTIGLLAEHLGLTYADLIGRIVTAASGRLNQAPHEQQL